MTKRVASILMLGLAIFLLTIPPHTWWLDLGGAAVVAMWVAVVATEHARAD